MAGWAVGWLDDEFKVGREHGCSITMSIWSYKETVAGRKQTRILSTAVECVYCSEPLWSIKNIDEDSKAPNSPRVDRSLSLRACRLCGWWVVQDERSQVFCRRLRQVNAGAAGCLRNLDLSSDLTPLEEIRQYLTVRFADRFLIDPSRFEEVVASVYRSLGYSARVTGRSGDGGIDIVLDGPGDTLIGVQVKRYKSRIVVDQIRSFAGALMLRGLTRGIFVTTSSFQSGSTHTANLAAARGFPIELVDAKRFYQALRISQYKAEAFDAELVEHIRDVQLIDLQVQWRGDLGSGTITSDAPRLAAYFNFEDALDGSQESAPPDIESDERAMYIKVGTPVRILGSDDENNFYLIEVAGSASSRDLVWVRESGVKRV